VVSSDQYEELYSKLELSVVELEKVRPRLKDCFFYFAAFPEDSELGVERDLFPLWLGDQIVGKKDPMGDAKELLDILVQRSLIEVRGDEFYERVHYVIHDVLRDLIRHMLQKLPLERRDCLYEAGQDLECFPEEYHKMSSPVLSAQRLSIMGSKVKELPPKLLNAPKLQVMMLRENAIEAIPAGFFSGNFRDLRVLDLRDTKIKSLPKSVKNLKQLVVLNCGSSELQKLSSSFVKAMTNLQVLNVEECDLEYLPSSIASLSKLQYLYAESGNDLWKEGGWLRNPFHSRATLADIMKLVLLKELEISIKSQEVLPEGMFKALKHLRVLRLNGCYKLSAIPEPMEDELQHLQVLGILGNTSLTSLPNSFGIVLKNLRDLDLCGCEGLLCLPEGLAGLPKLKYLNISYCRGLECFPSSFSRPGAFPALKLLVITYPSGRVSFPDLQPGAMPQLEHLDLAGWEQLVDFPKPIANLTKLRILDLRDCGNLRSLEHDGVGVQSLANLEDLRLDESKKILTLPDGLEALPKLRRIDISKTTIAFSQEVAHLVTRRFE
jgi:Leucine-rich repeat (LRR) protein